MSSNRTGKESRGEGMLLAEDGFVLAVKIAPTSLLLGEFPLQDVFDRL